MNLQSDLRISDACLVASVARSYYTAPELSGDPQRAEALVIEAIESLNPENVTGEAMRYAVVEVLVRAQMMSIKHPSTYLDIPKPETTPDHRPENQWKRHVK